MSNKPILPRSLKFEQQLIDAGPLRGRPTPLVQLARIRSCSRWTSCLPFTPADPQLLAARIRGTLSIDRRWCMLCVTSTLIRFRMHAFLLVSCAGEEAPSSTSRAGHGLHSIAVSNHPDNAGSGPCCSGTCAGSICSHPLGRQHGQDVVVDGVKMHFGEGLAATDKELESELSVPTGGGTTASATGSGGVTAGIAATGQSVRGYDSLSQTQKRQLVEYMEFKQS